jgi:hypothetical protein
MRKEQMKLPMADLQGMHSPGGRRSSWYCEKIPRSGGEAMLFMMICTWDPKDEKEVRTRSVTWKWPEDVKVISEFYDLQGQRTVYVVDANAKGLIAARAPWRDVIRFEIFPVYPTGRTKETLLPT